MTRWIMMLLGIVVLCGCARVEPPAPPVEPPAPPEVRTVQKPIAPAASGIEPPMVIVYTDLPEVPKAIRGPSPPIAEESVPAQDKTP